MGSPKWNDLLWDAVVEAIESHVSPAEFRAELASAWAEKCRRDAKDDVETLRGQA